MQHLKAKYKISNIYATFRTFSREKGFKMLF